jgi:hypothetical protein
MMGQESKARTRRRLNVLWLAMAGPMFGVLFALIVAGFPGRANAADLRDKNPPEVKALIGMKIISDNPATHHGGLPGFHKVGGSVLVEFTDQSALVIEEGFINKIPLFLIGKATEGATSLKVLGAQAIPPELYEFRLNLKKKGSPPVDYLPGRYSLSEGCSYNIAANDERIIIGLVKPEIGKEDCAHYSRRVGRAWRIDRKTGRIEAISTKGLQCYCVAEGNCE